MPELFGNHIDGFLTRQLILWIAQARFHNEQDERRDAKVLIFKRYKILDDKATLKEICGVQIKLVTKDIHFQAKTCGKKSCQLMLT